MKFECLLSLVLDYFITRSDGKFAYSSGTSIGELLGESQMKDFLVGRVSELISTQWPSLVLVTEMVESNFEAANC